MTIAKVTEVIFRLALLQTNLSKNSLGMCQVKTSCGFQHLSNNQQCYKHMDFSQDHIWHYGEPVHYKFPCTISAVKSFSGERARSFEFVDDADTRNYQE